MVYYEQEVDKDRPANQGVSMNTFTKAEVAAKIAELVAEISASESPSSRIRDVSLFAGSNSDGSATILMLPLSDAGLSYEDGNGVRSRVVGTVHLRQPGWHAQISAAIRNVDGAEFHLAVLGNETTPGRRSAQFQ